MAYNKELYKKKKIANLKKAIKKAHQEKILTDKQKQNLMDIASGKKDPSTKKQKKVK